MHDDCKDPHCTRDHKQRAMDAGWELDVTKQLERHATHLESLDEKQTDATESLDKIKQAMFGDPTDIDDPGLVGRFRELNRDWKTFKISLVKVGGVLFMIMTILGNLLTPVVRDWISDKLHMKIYNSPAKTYTDEAQRPKYRHYTIHVDPEGNPK